VVRNRWPWRTGSSDADVQPTRPASANLIADPPRPSDIDGARRGVAALDELRRPTLDACRNGPRSSALVDIYAGLPRGASAAEGVAPADAYGDAFIVAEPPMRLGPAGCRRALLTRAQLESSTVTIYDGVDGLPEPRGARRVDRARGSNEEGWSR
jgi:hypothetical protein